MTEEKPDLDEKDWQMKTLNPIERYLALNIKNGEDLTSEPARCVRAQRCLLHGSHSQFPCGSYGQN